jgi:hypothetical protein
METPLQATLSEAPHVDEALDREVEAMVRQVSCGTGAG